MHADTLWGCICGERLQILIKILISLNCHEFNIIRGKKYSGLSFVIANLILLEVETEKCVGSKDYENTFVGNLTWSMV